MSVVVESRCLYALIEPYLRTSGDHDSPLLDSSKKLAARSPKLTQESAYRYFTKLRNGGMHFVRVTRADETVLALLGDQASFALRSIPHFFDTRASALEAAEAHYAAEDDAVARKEVKRLARSLYNFSEGWKRELIESVGPSRDSQQNAAKRVRRQAEAVTA